MDIVLAMLASESAEKSYLKKWDSFPYNVERNVSSDSNDVALYRYLVNNAMQYPKRWFDNQYEAKVLASVDIHDGHLEVVKTSILEKSQNLDESDLLAEVSKTLNRANQTFPKPSETPKSMDFLLEWRLK